MNKPSHKKIYKIIFLITGLLLLLLVLFQLRRIYPYSLSNLFGTPKIQLINNPQTPGEKIVNGAKQEVIHQVRYDSAYFKIPYPNGDVPSDRGACTDVIIRGLRNAGYDLQQLIHEDMQHHFDLYPKKWKLDHTDPNIDHRRIPNHLIYFSRFGKKLPVSTQGVNLKSWQPGDFVYWSFTPVGPQHCGVISIERNAKGVPLVIHNAGPVAVQEDALNRWKIIGHYRYP